MNNQSIFAAALLLAAGLIGSTQIAAQPANSLRMPLYVIETTGVPERASEFGDYIQAHLAHQVDLERRGIMFGAGPLQNEDPSAGGQRSGLIIIRAESFEEARQIADTDPMHANGLRTYTIRRWSLNEGTVNVRVNFSDQSVQFE